MPDTATFAFRFDGRYRPLLRVLGVTPSTAAVRVGAGWLTVVFGRWRVETPLANVASAQVTGPFLALKVVGPHLSLADRGLSFGTSTDSGVCVLFHRPVTGIDPLGVIRHPGLTVTVADPEALLAALASRGVDEAPPRP